MRKSFILLALLTCPLVASAATPAKLGQTIFDQACSHCHSPEVAKSIGAPAAFDTKAWDKRMRAAKLAAKDDPRFKTALDYLLFQVQIGKGLMHHGGLCKESMKTAKQCTDAAYLAAIQYMSKKQAKE